MSSVRLLRSAAPSLPKLASRATSRCTTPTPMLLAWVTPVCGRSPSCPAPSTFSWLRWPCLSSPRWSHSVGRESTTGMSSTAAHTGELIFHSVSACAAHLRGHSLLLVLRTVLLVTLGLYSQYWLLIHVSGFQSLLSTLLCMLVCRAMFSVPYIHVNIFQVNIPE